MSVSAELVTTYGAAAAAAVYLIGLLRKAVRKLDAIDTITSRELDHNHGSSMKDDLHGMAVALGQTQRKVDTLNKRVDDLARAAQELHPNDAWRFTNARNT